MKSKNAILLVAGLGAIAGIVVLAKRAGAQPPGGTSAPQGSITLVSNKQMQLSGDRALFSLPNDVTFLVTGTVTAGNPAPNAQIVLEIQNPTTFAWVNVATYNPSATYSPGQNVTYSRFLTPDQLLAILGFTAPSYTARAHLTLTNSVGTITVTSSSVTFSVNPATSPPVGTVGITVSKVSNQLKSAGHKFAKSWKD